MNLPALTEWNYHGVSVRTIVRDGQPWFVARDVMIVLGLTNPTETVRGLDDDEFSTTEVVDSAGRRQPNTYIVNEPGLYSLILRSRKPEAKTFKRWITHEVIPTIRRTGGYGQAPRQELSRREMAQYWLDAETRAESAESRAAELEPDAARAKQTLDSDGLSLVGTVAKRFGIKEKALREFLYAERLLIRAGARRNEPMARYVQSGHFEIKTRLIETNPDRPAQSRTTTFVTPKGEGLIWRRLFEVGYVSTPHVPPRQLELVP